MNKWQVNMKIWQVNIKIWQDDIKIWQVNIIIWQVMAEICHHDEDCEHIFFCNSCSFHTSMNSQRKSLKYCLGLGNNKTITSLNKYSFLSNTYALSSRHQHFVLCLRVLNFKAAFQCTQLRCVFLVSEPPSHVVHRDHPKLGFTPGDVTLRC